MSIGDSTPLETAALERQAETLRDLRHRRERLAAATGAGTSTDNQEAWRKLAVQYDRRLVEIANTLGVARSPLEERQLLDDRDRRELERSLAAAGFDLEDPWVTRDVLGG